MLSWKWVWKDDFLPVPFWGKTVSSNNFLRLKMRLQQINEKKNNCINFIHLLIHICSGLIFPGLKKLGKVLWSDTKCNVNSFLSSCSPYSFKENIVFHMRIWGFFPDSPCILCTIKLNRVSWRLSYLSF